MMAAATAAILAATALPASTGGGWWQTVGGLAAVFGLLLLSLKLLRRLGRPRPGSKARLLDVWPLAPRREIQIVQLGDQVNFVYRHDNAMVLLKQQALAEFHGEHRDTTAAAGDPPAASGWLARLPWRQAQPPARQR